VPAPGRYLVTVDRAGYFQLHEQAVEIAAGGAETTLVLNVQEEVFQSVHVAHCPSSGSTNDASEERLSGTEINDIPYPSTERLAQRHEADTGDGRRPIRRPPFPRRGGNIQTQYTLNGVDITTRSAAATGRFWR